MKKSAAKRSQVAALNHRYMPQGEEIGRGASGIVHKALDLRTGGVVAIKQVTLKTAGREELTALQREIDLLKLLKNPYIVKYMESFNTRETLYIVMEFVENGSLASIVKRYGRLPESLAGMYTLQALVTHALSPRLLSTPSLPRCSRGCTACTSRASSTATSRAPTSSSQPTARRPASHATMG